jgi:hypothetical protein
MAQPSGLTELRRYDRRTTPPCPHAQKLRKVAFRNPIYPIIDWGAKQARTLPLKACMLASLDTLTSCSAKAAFSHSASISRRSDQFGFRRLNRRSQNARN